MSSLSFLRGLVCHLVVAGVLAFCTRGAQASPLFDTTGDTIGMGGLQPSTAPGGSAAAYWNPALLLDSPNSLEFGFVVLHQSIGISVMPRPISADIPTLRIANAVHGSTGARFDAYPLPTQYLEVGIPEMGDPNMGGSPATRARPRQGQGTGQETFTYEAIGLNLKLYDDRLALGFYGLIPNGDFAKLQAFYNDEREQFMSNSLHPELYGDRMTAISIALGMGLKIYKGLSLGAGGTISLAATMDSPVFVAAATDLTSILIDLDGAVNVSVAPHFGLSQTLLDGRLRLTGTAHAPSEVKVTTKFTFLLGSGLEQSSGVDFVLDWSPWQAELGVAGDVVHKEDEELTLAAGARYARWSKYEDRHGEVPTPSLAWSDTLSPTVGLRYRKGIFSSVADAAYTPTPVPKQIGRTNYVDNDRVSGALGTAIGFNVFDTDMEIGLLAQLHRLMPRNNFKQPTPTTADGVNRTPELVTDEVPDDAVIGSDEVPGRDGLQTNNPGWPGFSSEGWILAGSIYLRAVLF